MPSDDRMAQVQHRPESAMSRQLTTKNSYCQTRSKAVSVHKTFKVQQERHNGMTWKISSSKDAGQQIFAPIIGKKKPGRKPGQGSRLKKRSRSKHDGRYPGSSEDHSQSELPFEHLDRSPIAPRKLPPAGRLRDVHILPANLFTNAIRIYPQGALPAPPTITAELREVAPETFTSDAVRIHATLFDLLRLRDFMSSELVEEHGQLYRYAISLLSGSRSSVAWPVITAQTIGTLALISTLTGQYGEWDSHMKGVAELINGLGGVEPLPALVQLHIRKADIKGAFETLEKPKIPFSWAYEPIWSSLPQGILDVCAESIRHLFPTGDRFLTVRETFVEISYMAYVVGKAAQTQTMQQIELPRLAFSHFYLVQRLLTCPTMLTTPQDFLSKHSTEDSSVYCSAADEDLHVASNVGSLQEALRIAALMFFKLVKGGSRERWDQHVSHLWLLNGHLRRILSKLKTFRTPASELSSTPISTREPTNSDTLLASRGMLIWIALIGESFSAASEAEQWKWPQPLNPDPDVYHEILEELLGSTSNGAVNGFPEQDLEFCRTFHLGIMRNFYWDVRAEIARVLRRGV